MSDKPSGEEKIQIVWDEERRRFRTADAKAYLSYTVRPSSNSGSSGASAEQKSEVLDLQHTFVPAKFRGQGIAARLCTAAFEHAKDKGLLVQPTCSYISDTFLPRHSEWNALVVKDEKRFLDL